MRKFVCSLGEEVDLDNPETYNYLPIDTKLLDEMMFSEIGKALVYMDYFYPDIFPTKRRYMNNPYTNKKQIDCSYLQRQRIYKLIKEFADNRRNHYDDVLWYQEQIFIFTDETENMC